MLGRRMVGIILAAACALTGCVTRMTKVDVSNRTDTQTSVTVGETTTLAQTQAVTTSKQAEIIPESVEYTAYEETFQAEDAVLSGNAKIGDSLEGADGAYVEGLDEPGDSLELQIDAQTAQFYQIAVSAVAKKDTRNSLILDGVSVGEMVSPKSDSFYVYEFDNLYLEKGAHTISIGVIDGSLQVDAITVSASKTLSELTIGFGDKLPTLSNAKADGQTQAIYQYLCENFGKSVLSGQFATAGTNTELDVINQTAGLYPAIRFGDFMPYTAENTSYKGSEVEQAQQWAADGGLVGYIWHWAAPDNSGKDAFYLEDTDFRLSEAVTNVDIAKLDLSEIQALADDGQIPQKTVALVKDIDTVSAQLVKLQDQGITVLWRPLHEAGGGWFWWGEDKDSYLWLWKLLYTRQTSYFKLNNLIWIWNAQNADWYVGDKYCDVVSADIYGNTNNTSQINSLLALREITKNKPCALSECGDVPYAKAMARDKAFWSWFAIWSGEYLLKEDGTLSEEYNTADELVALYSNSLVITRDELPDFSKLAAQENENSE